MHGQTLERPSLELKFDPEADELRLTYDAERKVLRLILPQNERENRWIWLAWLCALRDYLYAPPEMGNIAQN